MSSTLKPAAASADVAYPSALFFHTVTLITVFAGAGAPTPLYRIYQEQWHTSPLAITFIFGIYAVSLLGALLIAGSISDHVGRRPTIFAALALQIITMTVFIFANGVETLVAARIVQGLATGIAASSIGAALVDASRRHGPTVNSLSPLIGMAVGSALSGVLVAFGPAPTQLIYVVMLAVNLLLAVIIWKIPETIIPRAGALASLRPSITVPVQARRALLQVTPIIIGLWTLGGFYMSLIPTLIAQVTGIQSPLLGGLIVTALMSTGAAAVYSQRNRLPLSVLTLGSALLVTGVLMLMTGIHMGNVPVLMIASLILGAGMGSNFLASVGMILPLARPDERAELLAVFYIVCYLSMCLPAILAGFTANAIGIARTADIFATVVILLNLGGYTAIRISRSQQAVAME
jgi:MFS family permease